MIHAEKPQVVSIRVSLNSCYCGVRLRDIVLSEECRILGLVRENNLIFLNENPQVKCDDVLLAVAINPMYAPELQVLLKRLKPLSDCQVSQQ